PRSGPCGPRRHACGPGWARRPDRRPTKSVRRCARPSSAWTRRPQLPSATPARGTGRWTCMRWRACAWPRPDWSRPPSMAAACARSAIRRASAPTAAPSAPGAWPPWRCWSAERPRSAEGIDQVDRGQGVGAFGVRVLDLGVVPGLHAGLEREALVHGDRQAEVVLGEGVVRAGFHQQGVEHFGVVGQLVAQVELATGDHAALQVAVAGTRAAVTGADFTTELGGVVVDEAAAEADGHGTLVLVRGEVVALVAAVGRDVVARAEAVGTGAGDVVAVGAGLVGALGYAVAIEITGDLGARAQRGYA